jgi:predicted transcriptional regulator
LLFCGDDSGSSRSRAEFTFYIVGSSSRINARFGTNIYQALDSLRGNTGQLDEFLFTIAEEPLTMNQIQERSGLTQSQVEYFIANLDSCNLIKKYNQSRWATTLPVITDNQMKFMRKDLAPMANNVAQFLKKEIHQIRTLYDKVKSPLDPSWEDISHLIVSKFIIDGTFHRNVNRLKRESDAFERDNRKMSVIPAFFLQKGGNNSNFGCNWYKFNEGGDQREVYVLHGAILDRYDIAMNKYRGDQDFSAGLFNISPEGGIHSLTDREKEMLRNLDWISGDCLMVPIVKAGTIKSLWPAMENIGRDTAEVAFAKFTDITDSYNKSSYSKFLDNDEDYIQVLIHSLFSLTIERLVRSGTVSQIPEPVPESCGVYLVFGKLF